MRGRKLITILLMSFFLVFAPKVQAEDVTFTYDESTKTLTFSGNGMVEGNEGYATNAWYQYANEAQKLVLEDGITGVGAFTFKCFEKLEEIDFPERMSYLGQAAFERCKSLQEVYLPDGISYYDGAFTACKSLKKVVFGSSEGIGGL